MLSLADRMKQLEEDVGPIPLSTARSIAENARILACNNALSTDKQIVLTEVST